MYCYIQSLVNTEGLNFSEEILKNIIELYTDIVLMFAEKGENLYIGG